MGKLQGKVIVVTGGHTGLGWGIAEAFTASRAHVAIVDLVLDEVAVPRLEDLSQVGGIEMVHYSTSKGAVIAFTKALARQASTKGVLTNAMASGPIKTGVLELETEEKHPALEEWKHIAMPESVLDKKGGSVNGPTIFR